MRRRVPEVSTQGMEPSLRITQMWSISRREASFGSSEREHEGLDAGVDELDLEQPVADWRQLADGRVHPL